MNGNIIFIRPSAGIVRNVSNNGNIIKSLVSVTGAKRVIIDGNFNGSGKFLRFINTHTDSLSCKSTIMISGGADSVEIKNIIAESNAKYEDGGMSTVGTIFIGTGNNLHIAIRQSELRNSTTGTTSGLPDYAIVSTSTGNQLTITDNDIYNFDAAGIECYHAANGARIIGNHLYYNRPAPAGARQTGIELQDGSKHIIQNNFVGGSARFCGGASWKNDGHFLPGNDVPFYGIVCGSVESDSSFVIGNTIQNFYINSGNSSFTGILGNGLIQIKGNLVGHPSTANSIVCTATGWNCYMCPIQVNSGTRSSEISDNEVANISSPGTPLPGYGIHTVCLYVFGNGFARVVNNKVHNITTNSYSDEYSSLGAIIGLYLWSSQVGYYVEGNNISALKATNPTQKTQVYGVKIEADVPSVL